MKLKEKHFLGILFIFILLIGIGSAYMGTSPKLIEGRSQSMFQVDQLTSFNQDMCQEGTDFVVKIPSLGCTPVVVRSDLLEEQDVSVFCELSAIKINPLIDIKAIDSISFSGGEYPPQVRSVGFHPSYSALGENRVLNNLMWDNIGYAVISLRQTPESELVNCEKEGFSEVCRFKGNLSAKIRYDLEGAFGIRKQSFYLPAMSDSEFSSKYGQYAFFDKRGFLRAENVEQDSASIVIYSGINENWFGQSIPGQNNKQKVGQINLDVGETSGEMFLPGFDCLATVKFRLEGIESADTLAKLSINSEGIDVKKDQTFLENKCEVIEIEKWGLNQKVRIKCLGDEDKSPFNLRITPSLSLEIENKNGEKEVYQKKVGEWLFGNESTDYYLAYAGTKSGSSKKEDLRIYVVGIPKAFHQGDFENNLLPETELKTAAFFVSVLEDGDNNLQNYLQYISVAGTNFYRWLVDGSSFDFVSYNKDGKLSNGEVIGGRNVKILDFGTELNFPLSSETEEVYSSALREYDKVISDYLGEKYDDDSNEKELSLDERASYAKILLADSVSQKHDLRIFCNEFMEGYSGSELDISKCLNLIEMSNTDLSTKYVLIEGNWEEISFERVVEPDFEDYGIEIVIKNESGPQIYKLRKDQTFYLNKEEYVKLMEVREDQAVLKFHLINKSAEKGIMDFLGSEGELLNKEVSQSFGSKYTFTLTKTYLTQLAKVSVIPNINYAASEVTFPFEVAVEKRAIQLSPEKTQDRVEKLNRTIAAWKDRSESLGTVVETMKKACLGVGAALTVKNIIGGAGGKTIARESVMYGINGWYEKCKDKKNWGEEVNSEEGCLLEHANSIDAEVEEITAAMNAQNAVIKEIQGRHTKSGTLGEKVVNTAEFIEEYSVQVKGSLSWIQSSSYSDLKEKSNNIQEYLNRAGWEQNIYSVDQAKTIELYSNLLKAHDNKGYELRLLNALTDVESNSKQKMFVKNLQDSVVQDGLKNTIPRIYSGSNTKKEVYDGDFVLARWGDMPEGKPVQSIIYGGELYYVVLNSTGGNEYFIWHIYYQNKTILDSQKETEIKNKYDSFIKYDSESYNNRFMPSQEPKLTYYETDPYKGLPAMVPFDAEHGWYAFIEQTIPTGRTIRTYDDSGAVNSFWVCNVGQNGLAEFENRVIADDSCQKVNKGTGQPYDVYPGLDPAKASDVISRAEKAIEEASRAYGDGVKRVTILETMYEVGSPAMDIPGIKCTDYMSPKDCQILFNVCDPVICPNSRCDFGGSYPVHDVIQSGIIGSIALCLPNWNEGIYVPVCLTGVKAGLDGYLSIAQAYQDCLAQNLATGETIGVCDEIHSIYLCEFFWRQAFPLAKIAVPKLLGILTGQNSRGGGEYMQVQAAWQNAKDSIDYFTQFYAVNAYNAFKARSTEEVGTAACGSFVSIAYPKGQGVLDMLTESDSPPQFNAKFDIIPYTTTTVPPYSQYKVFYHIYAGNDRGAYYKVYLKGSPGGSYFQGTGFGKMVDSGYIAKGDYASQTVDFTAPEGYKELCVVVNEQEECGFSQVTSNFALDYIKEEYIKNQATSENIASEEECISGSPNIYSLLNPNFAEGVDSLIDPAIYEKGLIRICATDNPGLGSDPKAGIQGSRWQDVGNCGNEKIRCWIDTESIKDAVEFEKTYNDSLKDLTEHYTEEFIESKGYLSEADFSAFVKNLSIETNKTKKIDLIEGIFGKVFFNNQQGFLHYLLGKIYGEFADDSFKKVEAPAMVQMQEAGEISLEIGEDCGEKIIRIARSKIGQDTTRYQDGAEVKDHVCATFVSKVLFESGALKEGAFCDSEGIEYTQAISEMIKLFQGDSDFVEVAEPAWKGSLQKGDVLILGCSGDPSWCKDGKKALQHIVIFDSYKDSSIAKVVHDGGMSSNISYGEYSIAGNKWYITQVWRASGCGESILGDIEDIQMDILDDFPSPIFKYTTSFLEKDFYFQYFGNSWNFKKGERSSFVNVNNRVDLDKEFEKGMIASPPSSRYRIYTLESKNYLEGLGIILSKEGLEPYDHLETLDGKVGFEGDQFYYISDYDQDYSVKFYLKYDNEWKWSINPEYSGWKTLDDFKFEEKDLPSQEWVQFYKSPGISAKWIKSTKYILDRKFYETLISLEGKNANIGAATLFFQLGVIDSNTIPFVVNINTLPDFETICLTPDATLQDKSETIVRQDQASADAIGRLVEQTCDTNNVPCGPPEQLSENIASLEEANVDLGEINQVVDDKLQEICSEVSDGKVKWNLSSAKEYYLLHFQTDTSCNQGCINFIQDLCIEGVFYEEECEDVKYDVKYLGSLLSAKKAKMDILSLGQIGVKMNWNDFSTSGLRGWKSLTEFREEERKLFQKVQDCSECGAGWQTCDVEECHAIGINLRKDCVYRTPILFGGNCEDFTARLDSSFVRGGENPTPDFDCDSFFGDPTLVEKVELLEDNNVNLEEVEGIVEEIFVEEITTSPQNQEIQLIPRLEILQLTNADLTPIVLSVDLLFDSTICDFSDFGDVSQDKIVVIDPGHGGIDSGAVSPLGTKEADLTLAYAQLLETEIDKLEGYSAYITHEKITDHITSTDTLVERKDFTKEKEADYFISLHFDSITNKSLIINRSTILVFGISKNDRQGKLDICSLADCESYDADSAIFANTLKSKLNGLSAQRYVRAADAGVLNDNYADVSILFEINFISNETMTDYVKKKEVKEAYVQAIVDSFPSNIA